jgi:hypothetical protein
MTMAKTLNQEPVGKTDPALQKASKRLKNGTLTPQQTAVIEECPSAYRPTMKRAFAGNSRSAAVKAFCLRCTGWDRAAVKNCTAPSCPLWLYRPYQDDSERGD